VDRRKKQVLITATIVEASAKNILDKGIRWQILGSNGGVALGATSEQGLYEALAKGNFVLGALSNSGVKVNIGGSVVFFPDLVFLYSLLEQGSGFHIISNPKVLTLDNQDASIKVGQDVPFPTGIKYDVNGNPIITYDYKYVGLDLNVVPHVTEKNIRLVLKLKVQEITGYLTNNVGGINYSVPITSTRELNSDVIVQNGQTVIIGGLISQKSLLGTSKVPVLGDAPLVGALFRSTHKENDKTNLFIFITPYVIDSPQDLAKLMVEHKKLAQALMKAHKKEEKKVEPKEDEEVVLPYN
jgi:general secretion pathway protein D